jgi:hypothetical protein
MASYKWPTPLAWLLEKAGEWDQLELYQEFVAVASKLDYDTIQDLYAAEMDLDGYFEFETVKEN